MFFQNFVAPLGPRVNEKIPTKIASRFLRNLSREKNAASRF